MGEGLLLRLVGKEGRKEGRGGGIKRCHERGETSIPKGGRRREKTMERDTTRTKKKTRFLLFLSPPRQCHFVNQPWHGRRRRKRENEHTKVKKQRTHFLITYEKKSKIKILTWSSVSAVWKRSPVGPRSPAAAGSSSGRGVVVAAGRVGGDLVQKVLPLLERLPHPQ